MKQYHQTENDGGGSFRIDYQLSSSSRISGVSVISNSETYFEPLLNPRLNGSPSLTTTIANQQERNVSITWLQTRNAGAVNELTIGFLRDRFFGPPSPGMQYEPSTGVAGLNVSESDRRFTGFPLYYPLGYSSFGAPLGGPFNLAHNVPQFSEAFTWSKGRNMFRTGISARFRQYNVDQSPASRGAYVFTNLTTSYFTDGGDSIASALLGYPTEILRGVQPAFGERIHEYAAFFQDDLKLNQRLVVNAGLRWDLFRPATESHDRLGNFDPATVTVRVAGKDGNSRSTLDTNYRDFSPHIGLAFQPRGGGKSVLRAGYAISYLSLVTQAVDTTVNRLEDNPPFSLNADILLNPFVPSTRVSEGLALIPQNPKSLCCGIGLYSVPRFQPTPYVQQWNLDFQRSFAKEYLLDAAYVGSRGVHLSGSSNINQAAPGPTPPLFRSPISPTLGFITAIMNRESSAYHSFQLKVQHHFTHGFYLLAGYTYSHSIDDGSSTTVARLGSSAEPQNSFDWRAERASSDFDVRHRVVGSFLYELPNARGTPAWLGRALRNWQLNGILTGQSGMPFTPFLANGRSFINSGAGGEVRPDIIGNPSLSSGQSVEHWFNVSAFAIPGPPGPSRTHLGMRGAIFFAGRIW